MKIFSLNRSRRKVLLWGGLATLGLAFGGLFHRRDRAVTSRTSPSSAGTPASPSTPGAVTLDAEAISAPNHEVYSPLLNTEFTVEFSGTETARIRLVEVTPMTTITAPKAKYQSFSLFFEAAEGTAGDGVIARVNHPRLQPMDLFLAPVGRPKNGTVLLEAAFTERV